MLEFVVGLIVGVFALVVIQWLIVVRVVHGEFFGDEEE